jgi:hypothetical protein
MTAISMMPFQPRTWSKLPTMAAITMTAISSTYMVNVFNNDLVSFNMAKVMNVANDVVKLRDGLIATAYLGAGRHRQLHETAAVRYYSCSTVLQLQNRVV